MEEEKDLGVESTLTEVNIINSLPRVLQGYQLRVLHVEEEG
jgi:hypothetical protein